MDKIEKALKKLSTKERDRIKSALNKLISGKTKLSEIKKLKGREDIFRIRCGDLRIIYRVDSNNRIFILAISRRNEKTYKF